MITEKSIQKALKAGKLQWLTDPGDRGAGRLALQIRKLKTRVIAEWYAVSRRGGKRQIAKIGTYPDMSLASARMSFQSEFSPGLKTGKALRRRAAKAPDSLSSLFAAYVADLRRRGKKSAAVIERILKEAADKIGGSRPAADIEPEDITPLLAAIYRRGAQAYVNSFRGYLSAAFTFGLKAEHDFTRQGSENGWGLKTNPVTAIPINQGGVRAGNRFLTPAELRSFWLWLDVSMNTSLIAAAVKLRIATGQRSEEILRLDRAIYDRSRETLNWETTKNGLPHSIPLPRQAVEVLEAIVPNRHGLYFPHRSKPDAPASYGSMWDVVGRFLADRPEFPHFSPRDLRRTWKTLAGDAGISKEMRDRLQNHSQGDVSSRHYDRYEYLPEKRAAMETWSTYLDRVIAGTVEHLGRGNVIPLRKEGAA
jgi:integrase